MNNSQVLQLRIVFSSPGRIRFHLSSDTKEIPNLDDILNIKGVKETAFNKMTKSLLIIYDKKILAVKQLLATIRQKIPKVKIISKERHKKVEQLELASHRLYKTFRKINKDVGVKTKGRVDIFSSALILSLVWGMEELIRNPVMPKWYDILRFSQTLFTEIEIEEEV